MRHDDRAHYLYRCFDRSGRLLYVGSTWDLHGRLAAHKAKAHWAGDVERVIAKVFPDGPASRAAERRAIGDEHPLWNITGRWQHRHTWSREHWHDYLTALAVACGDKPSFGQARHLRTVESAYRLRYGVPFAAHAIRRAA